MSSDNRFNFWKKWLLLAGGAAIVSFGIYDAARHPDHVSAFYTLVGVAIPVLAFKGSKSL